MQIEKVKDQEELRQDLVAGGATLRRTQTQFTTAIAVVKPRERNQVIRACEEEAALAGDEFYYSWTLKGGQLVEGLSVGAALMAARNWGNCAIPCHVDEEDSAYIFTATFLDMETGFNLQRTFRQRKAQNVGMKKDTERAEDIVFQIGQSKAIRNVILNALPSWLTSKMLAKAKENVIAKIEKMGIDVARKKTVDFFAKYGIGVERVEEKVGKKLAGWDAETLALLQGAMSSLLAGQESADSLFPPMGAGTAAKTNTKAEALIKKLATTKETVETLGKETGGIPLFLKPGEEAAIRLREVANIAAEGQEEFVPSPGVLADMITVLTQELKITRPSVLFESVIGKGKVLDEASPEKQMVYFHFLEDCKAGKRGFQWDANKATYIIVGGLQGRTVGKKGSMSGKENAPHA